MSKLRNYLNHLLSLVTINNFFLKEYYFFLFVNILILEPQNLNKHSLAHHVIMQEKVHFSEKCRVTFFEAENKKRVLAISTHVKNTKTAVENGYF